MRVRNHKGRFVSERALIDRVTELKRAGFTLSYAWRNESRRYGHLSTSQLDGEYIGGHRARTVSGPSEVYGEPYVSFDSVACGEDRYGQVPAWLRSNYRSLKRDFPEFPWVDTSYTNTDALGCFVADLDDDMTGTMVGLAETYPLYDESDVSELEHEEIHESWAAYMRGEVQSELPEVTRTVIWDALGEDTVTDLWWACASDDVFGSYPEHNGVEVVWGGSAERAAQFRPYLIHAYVSVRQGGILPHEWDMVPMIHKFRTFREGNR